MGSTHAILNNVILDKAPEYMGGVNGQYVLRVGAAGLQTTYQGEMLHGARRPYFYGLHASWAKSVALFGVIILCALATAGVGRLAPKVSVDEKVTQEEIMAAEH